MKIWQIAIIVFAAGVLGGLVNALLSGNTQLLPHTDPGPPKDVYIPGMFATMLAGGLAAVISWGLYGASGGTSVIGTATLTVAAMAGALIIGFGGARWLTNEVDKTLLNKATAIAADQPKSETTAKSILNASPMKTLQLLRNDK